jgi:REP element-mobilizing transposase RayT
MVRFARVVALDVAHHGTQRGNVRRFILETDQERRVYLDLLQQGIQHYGVGVIGYCLVSNHWRAYLQATQDESGRKASPRGDPSPAKSKALSPSIRFDLG